MTTTPASNKPHARYKSFQPLGAGKPAAQAGEAQTGAVVPAIADDKADAQTAVELAQSMTTLSAAARAAKLRALRTSNPTLCAAVQVELARLAAEIKAARDIASGDPAATDAPAPAADVSAATEAPAQ